MTTTGLLPETNADIARVTEALAMITPRWNVRILLALALADGPLRYSEISGKLPWLRNGQLHPKVRSLCDAGLVQRTEQSGRHVTYGLTDRATTLLQVLPAIVTWAEQHLEAAGQSVSAIEQIEDSLTLLTRRHASAILWVLKARGETGGRTMAKLVMPDGDWTNIYPPLRQLVADGLVDTDGIGQPYRLSEAGEGLGTVFGALSAWSAGQPLAQAAQHPVWGRARSASAPQVWVSHRAKSQLPAPRTAPASHRTPTAPPTWQNRDLFSHATPPRPQVALTTGGPRR
ncbi:winged helix-turn-helix transcriptional regulator [Streptomyces sp. NPDC056149]|uniref:winged helix-turn-helix transcriptional regulator n=1 Tax=Streptomyces sp. NPDC056149 TaxID=3345728 RepID=UPI0035D9D962